MILDNVDETNSSNSWQTIIGKLANNTTEQLTTEEKQQIRNHCSILKEEHTRNAITSIISELSEEAKSETISILNNEGKKDLIEKLLCKGELSLHELQEVHTAFKQTDYTPEKLAIRTNLINILNQLNSEDKELICEHYDNPHEHINNGNSLELFMNNKLELISNNRLQTLVNLKIKLPELRHNQAKKRTKILNQLREISAEDWVLLNKSTSVSEQEADIEGVMLTDDIETPMNNRPIVSRDSLDSMNVKELETVLNKHLTGPKGPGLEALRLWAKSLKFPQINALMSQVNDLESNEHLKCAAKKLFRKDIAKLSLEELCNLKIQYDCSDCNTILRSVPKEDETDLERMERTYQLPKYTLAIHSPGLANDKLAGNVGARIREIKRLTCASRILSSSINGCLETKNVYTKIETDNKEDYIKVLQCDWPPNSFDCFTKPTVVRESLGFKLEIKDVDKDIKLELHRDSINDLKRQGLRNLKRATRYDHDKKTEQVLNRIEFNVTNFETLRAVILDGVSIELTKRNHDVQPNIERVRACKNCQDYNHSTKSCKNQPRCGKCSSDEIIITQNEQADNMIKNDMVEWFEAFVQTQNIGGVDNDLREEVEILKKIKESHSNKLEQLEKNINGVEIKLTEKINQVSEELTSRIDLVNVRITDLNDELKQTNRNIKNQGKEIKDQMKEQIKNQGKEIKDQMNEQINSFKAQSSKDTLDIKNLLFEIRAQNTTNKNT